MVWSANRKWFGYYQQDESYPNRMDPLGNMRGFLDRLDVKRKSPGASPDIWLNIFWLQQRPGEPTADLAYRNGRREYLTEIQGHVDEATQIYDNQSGGTVGWNGDPVWLADVLRAEGLTCNIADGAFNRGHGDMGNIWGIVAHHTGSNNASWQSIAFHPDLGLASQLHLSRDGVYTLCGVGIAWHAGNGSWSGLGTNNANPRTIGIEAANDGGGSPGKPHRSSWPDVQYDAYVRGCAAILKKLGYGPDHVIGHKEWAGAAQGKWDPGAINMDVFRTDIGGELVSAPRTNAIDEMYKISPWLGQRLTPELGTPDGRGRFSHFEKGSIYWTPEHGAFAIPANLFTAYAGLNWEKGPLGYPVAPHTVLKGGDVQAFEKGVLYRKYGQKGYFVSGAIGDRYRRMSYEAGPLGWPASNETAFTGGIYQDFDNGRIAWSPDGTVALKPGAAFL